MGILLQYASLPSLERASPRIAAFNTLLDDENGALTRCDTVGVSLNTAAVLAKQQHNMSEIVHCLQYYYSVCQPVSCPAHFAMSFRDTVIIAR